MGAVTYRAHIASTAGLSAAATGTNSTKPVPCQQSFTECVGRALHGPTCANQITVLFIIWSRSGTLSLYEQFFFLQRTNQLFCVRTSELPYDVYLRYTIEDFKYRLCCCLFESGVQAVSTNRYLEESHVTAGNLPGKR